LRKNIVAARGDRKNILIHDADFRKNSSSATHFQLNFSFLFGKGAQEFQKIPLKEKNYLKIYKTILFNNKYGLNFLLEKILNYKKYHY
jgi:hypothetical protein